MALVQVLAYSQTDQRRVGYMSLPTHSIRFSIQVGVNTLPVTRCAPAPFKAPGFGDNEHSEEQRLIKNAHESVACS